MVPAAGIDFMICTASECVFPTRLTSFNASNMSPLYGNRNKIIMVDINKLLMVDFKSDDNTHLVTKPYDTVLLSFLDHLAITLTTFNII